MLPTSPQNNKKKKKKSRLVQIVAPPCLQHGHSYKQFFLSGALFLSEVMPCDGVTDWTTIKGWIEPRKKIGEKEK